MKLAPSPLANIQNVIEALIVLQKQMPNTQTIIDVAVFPLASQITWSVKRASNRGSALRVMHTYSPIGLTYVERDGSSQIVDSDLISKPAGDIVKALNEIIAKAGA